jgi:SAM-dependent methyltransferase
MRPYRVASTYDPLTLRLFPYPKVAAYISGRLHEYRPDTHTILDVACGTGNLTLPLAALGYQVAGLDIAEEMLVIARGKAAAAGLDLPFICQDMCRPYAGALVDAATCFYGGLNFLSSSEALRQAFASIHAALKPGGLLVFDQFSAAKMRAAFSGTRAGDLGEFYAVTRSTCDDTGQVTHNVSFFLREADGRYRREEEQHHIRIHPFDEIKLLLAACGFELLLIEEIYPFLQVNMLQDVYLFVARKTL